MKITCPKTGELVQVKFFRTQPSDMKHLIWEDEISRQDRHWWWFELAVVISTFIATFSAIYVLLANGI